MTSLRVLKEVQVPSFYFHWPWKRHENYRVGVEQKVTKRQYVHNQRHLRKHVKVKSSLIWNELKSAALEQ